MTSSATIGAPSVGSPAPGFSFDAVLPNLSSARRESADYRGRWVALLFYPRDFSFVCPTELTGFSAEIEQFDRRGCDLLGVSIDDPETHRSWLETATDAGGVEGLRFPLASDPDGATCKAYGLWRSAEDLPSRGLFLIDPEGILRYSVVYDTAVGRSVGDVVRVLDALQAGGLCPVNWKRADGVLDVATLLQPGRVLGHYRIEREIGSGSFGHVFAADDLRLQRKVALKVLDRQGDASEAQLLDEARMAARVNHPNVCTVHAAEVIDTLPTIVMEFIEGKPLSREIGAGLDADRFRAVASRLAAGLAAAHAEGVVHGDIKPANVLLRGAGEPVLVDFGLAHWRMQRKRVSAAPAIIPIVAAASADDTVDETVDSPVREAAEQEDDPFVTATIDTPTEPSDGRSTGGISGTPAYMSPEQARGEILGEPSDLFSLGLVFVEMLKGSATLAGLRLNDILQTLQDDAFLRGIPDGLQDAERAVLADVFSLAPERRPTAKELATRLG